MFTPRDPWQREREPDPAAHPWNRLPLWGFLTVMSCLLVFGVVAWRFGRLAGIGAAVGVFVLFAAANSVKSGRLKAAYYADPVPEDADPYYLVGRAAYRGDVDYLIRALTDPRVRSSAARRLGNLGDRRAVPQLILNLGANDDMDRAAAIRALKKIGDQRAVAPLYAVATEDEAFSVRTTAIDALATLGDRRGIDLLTDLAFDPTPILRETNRYLSDFPRIFRQEETARWTRRWAILTLAELGASSAEEALQRASIRSVGLRDWIWLRRARRALRKSRRR